MELVTEKLATEDELDALKEILNIGAGNAARVLSEMVDNKPIELGVPEVEIYSTAQDSERPLPLKTHNIVSLNFVGQISGQAALLFDRKHSGEIIKLLVDEDEDDENLEAYAEEVFSEVGNIVINGIISAIGNLSAGTEYSFAVGVDTSVETTDIDFRFLRDIVADSYTGGDAFLPGRVLNGVAPETISGDAVFVVNATQVAAVPEPSATLLSGLAGLVLLARRRRRS